MWKPGTIRIAHALVDLEPMLVRLSKAEAWQIAKEIRASFAEYVAKYDTDKYWPVVYQRIRREFRQPQRVLSNTLRDALLWKYGHLGKPAIPQAHELLITQLQRGWPSAVVALPSAPKDAFDAIGREFGGKTRFITVAFLVHLLHPHKVPIIDQHNFRAVNAFRAAVRPTWRIRRRPSRYDDISLLAEFMKSVLTVWRQRAPKSVPSARNLDKFLMMYGKAIKSKGDRPLSSLKG